MFCHIGAKSAHCCFNAHIVIVTFVTLHIQRVYYLGLSRY